MSRPSPTPAPSPLPPCLEPCPEGTRLRLKVQPRASRNEVGPPEGEELRVRVTAPPVDAAANEAVLELLAETLGCRRGGIHLLRGQTSRHKLVLAAGLDAAVVRERLAAPR